MGLSQLEGKMDDDVEDRAQKALDKAIKQFGPFENGYGIIQSLIAAGFKVALESEPDVAETFRVRTVGYGGGGATGDSATTVTGGNERRAV